MKKNFSILGSVFLLIFFLISNSEAQTHIFVDPTLRGVLLNPDEFVPDEVVIKFKDKFNPVIIDAFLQILDLTPRYTSPFGSYKRIGIPFGRDVIQMIEILKSCTLIDYIEPNYIARAFYVPNDPLYSYQWNFDNSVNGGIHMPSAWNITKGDPSIIVAVVDTGVAYENYTQGTQKYYQAPDLAQTNFIPGWDFSNNDAHPNDDEGHGTHVTGTIAQASNNSLGVAGIAPNTSIMPVKVLDSSGSGAYTTVADGIRYAADHGAKIINLSLGGSSSSNVLQDACAYAYNKGVTLVCAAGNDSKATLGYPAAYDDYCIAVGATRFDETRAPYSNYGPSLDIVAPGGDLNVDQNKDGYGDGILQQTFGSTTNSFAYYFYQGTSMATPHVSGVAALLLALHKDWTPAQVREALQSSAKDLGPLGFDSNFGWGLLDAVAALNYNSIPNAPPKSDAGGPYSGTEDTPVQFDGSHSFDDNGDPLTYSWNFGDGTNGSGVNPTHAYTGGGTYNVSLIVNDGKVSSQPATTTAQITEVNDAPVARVGGPYTGIKNESVQFDGSGSYDTDGSITNYSWDFGDGQSGTGLAPTHTYAFSNQYNVKLTVTDNGGLTNSSTTTVSITDQPVELQVFADSFEVGQWNGLWTEDIQKDWRRSTRRAVDGTHCAEIHGSTIDGQLISIPINLQGKTNATVSFSWYISHYLRRGEYIAFDISTNNGASWVEQKRLRGDIDVKDQWHNESFDFTNINSLRLRFRGTMSSSIKDAEVDVVKVIAK